MRLSLLVLIVFVPPLLTDSPKVKELPVVFQDDFEKGPNHKKTPTSTTAGTPGMNKGPAAKSARSGREGAIRSSSAAVETRVREPTDKPSPGGRVGSFNAPGNWDAGVVGGTKVTPP